MASSRDPWDSPLLAAGASLHADTVAAEAARALGAAGVECILLRGAVIARHLYDDDETRVYMDADLLIPHARREDAEGILRALGFEREAVLGQRAADRPPWSSTWVRRGDAANVDLHWSLAGVHAEADEIWSELRPHVESLSLLGERLDGLDMAAIAFVTSLHAAHHGAEVRYPRADLERAVERMSRATWEQARELAARLEALDAFGAGLRLSASGARLATELDVPLPSRAETVLRAESAPATSLGFEWLARTPGVRRKLALVGGKIVPDQAFMRAWSPLAREGGKRGLVLAYVWRPLWLLWHALPGLRAWLTARRKVERNRARRP